MLKNLVETKQNYRVFMEDGKEPEDIWQDFCKIILNDVYNETQEEPTFSSCEEDGFLKFFYYQTMQDMHDSTFLYTIVQFVAFINYAPVDGGIQILVDLDMKRDPVAEALFNENTYFDYYVILKYALDKETELYKLVDQQGEDRFYEKTNW